MQYKEYAAQYGRISFTSSIDETTKKDFWMFKESLSNLLNICQGMNDIWTHWISFISGIVIDKFVVGV
jgi:hypothetical protein